MDPAHWRRVEEIYHAAAERKPEKRAAFLAVACAGEENLRREVESLLAQPSADGILDRPAWEPQAAAGLAAGQRVSHYQIQEKLGEGGMGVVYRAYDTQLRRPVALKILPPEYASDPERRSRLLREARSASALHHPNIVGIHEVGSDNGVDFIAMEFIEGKTLGDIIPARGLPLGKALDCAAQIAGGLAKAHASGVVHRDLKPGNIMLAGDGLVKLLDFGLARRVELAEGHDTTLTVQGEIAGTPAYMSPEQAQGKPPEASSDVFSFGSVLYQMVTGQQAFGKGSLISTLAAVVEQEPRPLPASLPRDLAKVIARCLRKDPARRYQHMGDVKVELEDLKSASDPRLQEREPGSVTSVEAVPRRRPRFVMPALAALSAAILSIAGSWLYWRPAPPGPETILTRVTTDAGLTTDPTLSPDGKMIAYASDRSGDGGLDIWIQQVANGESVRLTNDPADDRQPVFSPDGSTIAFRSERDHGGIYTVPAVGGEARLVIPEGFDPQYSPDGQSIAYWTGYVGTAFPARTWIFSLNGRTQRQIRADFARVTHPIWSPDGKFLLFVGSPQLGQIHQSASFDWWITPAEEGNATRTGAFANLTKQGFSNFPAIAWLPTNEVLCSASLGSATNIWRMPISRPSFRIEGRPLRVTMGTQTEVHPSVTRENMVAYAAENSATEVWSLNLKAGADDATHDLVRLVGGGGSNIRPTISRDGNTLAYLSNKTGRPLVWIKNLVRGTDRALTGGSRPEHWPVVSPDGTKVAYTTIQNPTAAQLRAGVPLLVAEVRTGIPQAVCPNCSRPEDWSPDGRKIIGWTVANGNEIAEFDLVARKREILIKESGHDVVSPRYSPDGNWISFQERTGAYTRQLWIAPLDGGSLPIPPSRWIAITDNASIDREARWSQDGSTIYFASNRDGFQCLWSQRLDPSTKKPEGTPAPLHHFHGAGLGITLEDSGHFGMG